MGTSRLEPLLLLFLNKGVKMVRHRVGFSKEGERGPCEGSERAEVQDGCDARNETKRVTKRRSDEAGGTTDVKEKTTRRDTYGWIFFSAFI